MRTQLEVAREVVAAYWRASGYENDAVTVENGDADFSADVQCALIAAYVEHGYTIPTAVELARKGAPINANSTTS